MSAHVVHGHTCAQDVVRPILDLPAQTNREHVGRESVTIIGSKLPGTPISQENIGSNRRAAGWSHTAGGECTSIAAPGLQWQALSERAPHTATQHYCWAPGAGVG